MMHVNSKIMTYLKEARKLISHSKNEIILLDIIRFFPFWMRNYGKISLDSAYPWLTLPAINYLKKITKPGMLVFEYGSGGSTLFFAKTVDKVITIEHDPSWGKKVEQAVKDRGYYNVKIDIIQPHYNNSSLVLDTSDPNSYFSGDENLSKYKFDDYVKSIDKYPDHYFDIILIDGRARASCIKKAVSKINKNGYIILDDAEREYYLKQAKEFIKSYQTKKFPGLAMNSESLFSKITVFFYARKQR